MADIISRLKLESGEFDSKIKRASQELTAYSQHCRKMGLEMGYANKDAKEFAKSLGSMQTTATTARGKVSELSDAFVNLKAMYNQMTDAEKRGEFGKNLAASLDQLKQRTQQAKQELADITKELNSASNIGGGGGLFSSDKLSGMLQVFGGNLMTKGLELATGAVSSLASEIGGMITQGVELARQGEGIRIAFERLGRGDILQGLREATHGTVTDLELMKAAVKFNDFKLPVEELGTMLAFAQQKAKDTGQSVDYMVDSIVTGLGRKSLMILDNLGLSATEIRERMKETGDMTKAVGAIIRDQMAAAGDYVETAADRAAQANVSLQNKMEELGSKFAPVEEASNQLWTSMKIGILDIIGGPLARMLNELTEAGRRLNAMNDVNGNNGSGQSLAQRRLNTLREYSGSQKGVTKQTIYDRTVARYAKEEEQAWRKANEFAEKYKNTLKELNNVNPRTDEKGVQASAIQQQANKYKQQQEEYTYRAQAIRSSRVEYERGANEVMNPKTTKTTITTTTTDPKKGAKEKELTELQQNQQKINDLTQEYVKLGDESTEVARERQAEIQKEIELLKQRNGLLGLRAEQAQGRFLIGAGDFQKSGLSNNPGTLLSTPNTSVSGLMLDDKAMKAVNKQLEAMGKSNIKQLAEVGKETANAWRGAAGAMSAAGSALQGLEDPGAKIAGVVGQAIANIALGFSQATAASSGGGIFGWIAAIAGGLTTMLSTISAIHSATGYAQGGIVDGRGGGFVGGMAYSGDNVGNVRLDSGELVLNRSQQNNLANALEGGTNNNVENRQPYVNGELIYLGVNNYLKRTGRGEIVVSKR